MSNIDRNYLILQTNINHTYINMVRKYSFLMVLAFSLMSIGICAQTKGYYRLQNVATNHITHLEGITHFSPSSTLDEAHSQPGTVAYLDFEGKKITALSAQNVDVVNQVIPMLKMLILQTIDEPTYYMLRDSAAYYTISFMSAAVADLAVPLINKFTYEDFQEYIYNTDTNLYKENAGNDNYYLYANLPKFPLNAGILTTYLVGKANENMTLLHTPLKNMAANYLIGREYLIPTMNSLIDHFFFEEKIYLTEINDPTYGPQFGFVNADELHEEYVKDKWLFLPVDDDGQYLGVESQLSDADGNCYAAVSWAFPVKLSSGMKAYYLEDELDLTKSQIKRHEITEEVIPAMTPMIIQLNGPSAADNIITPVINESANVIEGNVLQCATDSLGFLFGFELPRTDPHYYVLGTKDGKVGLVEATQISFAANTAYYYLDESRKQDNPSGFLELTDVVDAINSVAYNESEEQKIYDLQGRSVEHPVKGIYIINGKKVMVK